MSSYVSSIRALNAESRPADVTAEWIAEVFDRAGLSLDPAQSRAFLAYEELLLRWNAKVNLTAIRDAHEVVYKHFLDSALVLSHVELNAGATIADIGTGAGFPGVPLAILRPDIHVTLFEPVIKKIAFLHAVKGVLNLPHVALVPLRLEPKRLPKEWHGVFDGVVSRYTASLSWLAVCARFLLREGGWLLAHKYDGEDESQILAELPRTQGATCVAWKPDFRVEENRYFAYVRF